MRNTFIFGGTGSVQDFYKLDEITRKKTIVAHFAKWSISHDSRQDNFERNVQLWNELQGWKLSPTYVRELNNQMRDAAGRLWNYTGD